MRDKITQTLLYLVDQGIRDPHALCTEILRKIGSAKGAVGKTAVKTPAIRVLANIAG